MIFSTISVVLGLSLTYLAQAQFSGVVFSSEENGEGVELGSDNVTGECIPLNGDLPPSKIAIGTGELIICTPDDCEGGTDGTGCQSFEIPTGCLNLLASGLGPGSVMLA